MEVFKIWEHQQESEEYICITYAGNAQLKSTIILFFPLTIQIYILCSFIKRYAIISVASRSFLHEFPLRLWYSTLTSTKKQEQHADLKLAESLQDLQSETKKTSQFVLEKNKHKTSTSADWVIE